MCPVGLTRFAHSLIIFNNVNVFKTMQLISGVRNHESKSPGVWVLAWS